MTDGCVRLLYISSWKIHQIAAGQLLSGQPVQYGKGRRYGPSYHVQKHTCRVTLLQPARRADVLGQPSSLRLHWYVPSALLDRTVCPGRSCSAVSRTHFQLLYRTNRYDQNHAQHWPALYVFFLGGGGFLFNTASSAAPQIPLRQLVHWHAVRRSNH